MAHAVAVARSEPCQHCGGRGNLTAYTAGFRAGQQATAYETYELNIGAGGE